MPASASENHVSSHARPCLACTPRATERVCCNSIITFGALFGSALSGPVCDALGKKMGMFAVCTRLLALQASGVGCLVVHDCML